MIPDWLERIAVCCRPQMAAMAVRREVCERLGGFNPIASTACDWELWVRIAAHGPVWYEPRVLAHYRMHPGSETTAVVYTGAQVADGRRAIDLSATACRRRCDRLTRRANHLALYAVGLARRQRDAGEWAAWANLRQALECSRAPEVVNAVTKLFRSDEDIP